MCFIVIISFRKLRLDLTSQYSNTYNCLSPLYHTYFNQLEDRPKLFDFYIIWKPLMKGFQSGFIFFKFDQAVPKIF